MSFVRDLFSLPRRISWADVALFAALGGVIYWLVLVSRQWSAQLQPSVEIHTQFRYLPLYTLFSLSRGLAAYIVSLLFTIVYGYVMAHSKRAEKIMLPMLDVLQSIPILAFLPGLVLALVALFPRSNIGLELATILTIFTGQVWNMTFAFYHSLKAIPNDLRDASKSFYLSKKETLLKLELPSSAIPLVWNSMMSMAGGWFFLSVSEAFSFGDKDFKLPGIGSYMKVAVDEGNVAAMLGAVVAMAAMIIFLDRLLWRPLVIWSSKFRVEEMSAAEEGKSFILDIFQRSEFVRLMRRKLFRRKKNIETTNAAEFAEKKNELYTRAFEKKEVEEKSVLSKILGIVLLVITIALLAYGAFRVTLLFTQEVSANEWGSILAGGGWTLLRTIAAVIIGAAWTIPVGAIIGMNPRLSQRLQPVTQFIASFPAPMFFPLLILMLANMGISIEVGAVFLMLLGTQWYMLFNVIAGASSIPTDLQEMFHSYNVPRWIKWKKLILPALYPSLVTGGVTAAGGAWNASIVSEFVEYKKHAYVAHGIGSLMWEAFGQGNFALLGAGIFTLCLIVVGLNKLVWRPLFTIAQDRYALNS